MPMPPLLGAWPAAPPHARQPPTLTAARRRRQTREWPHGGAPGSAPRAPPTCTCRPRPPSTGPPRAAGSAPACGARCRSTRSSRSTPGARCVLKWSALEQLKCRLDGTHLCLCATQSLPAHLQCLPFFSARPQLLPPGAMPLQERQEVAPPPKFVRDTLDTSDIAGTRVRPRCLPLCWGGLQGAVGGCRAQDTAQSATTFAAGDQRAWRLS